MNSNSNYLKYHDLLSPLYAQEWLKLKLQSTSFKFSSCTPQFLSIPMEMVELIINICLEFQLNSEIEFTALDLIDYYFMKYYLKLKKYNNMFKIKETIRKNGFLHIISALIIATKYVERKFCSIDNLKIFLTAASSNFTINEIKSAEFYVFETIGFRFICVIALAALVSAGGPADYSISAVSGDHASVGNSHEHTVKGLYGQNVLSQYSQGVDSAHSTVRVSSSRHSNDAYAPHYGSGHYEAASSYGHGGHGYAAAAAPISFAHHGYAAPAVISHHGLGGPAIAHSSYAAAAPISFGHGNGYAQRYSHSYAAPAISHSYAAAPAISHSYAAAPAISHSYAAAPAISHSYAAAPAISHSYAAAPAISHSYSAAPAVSYSHASPLTSYSHNGPAAYSHGSFGHGSFGHSGLAIHAAPIAAHASYSAAAPIAYKTSLAAAPIAHTSFVGHGASYGW